MQDPLCDVPEAGLESAQPGLPELKTPNSPEGNPCSTWTLANGTGLGSIVHYK